MISKGTIRDFADQHANVSDSLYEWYTITSNANWKNFAEMKASFNSVDAVGNGRYVFNIKGNNYRLIALIIFKTRTVFILFVGTHREYDKVDASTVEFKR